MSYWVAILVVIACSVGAAGVSYVVDRAVSIEQRRRHHEVGEPVFHLIGIMFSVLLAFVFSEVWNQYNTAAQAISGECGALHGASILANALPDKQGRPVNQAIVRYAKTVVDEEWATMGQLDRSPQAAEDLRQAMDLAARLNLTRSIDISDQQQILALLAEAHNQRETRTFQIDLGLPLAMWTVMILLSGVLIGFVILSGSEAPGSVIFAGSFTGSIVMVLVLVRMLDFPFQGALALDNADFLKLIGEVSGMVAGG